MGKCLECGKSTKNPKFCNRSCAAKYNNKKHPKRKPEGTCSSCGAIINSRDQFCDPCRKIEEEKNRKKEKGIKSWRSIDGETIERVIPKIYNRTKIVFKHSSTGKITSKMPIGEIIDLIIGIAFSEPPYMRKTDILRYASLLDDFSKHKLNYPRSTKIKKKAIVANIPVSGMDICIDSWIRSIMNNGNSHPLMSTYAIDTALFIEKILFGEDFDSPEYGKYDAEIEPLLYDEENRKYRRRELFDSGFKKDVTQRNIGHVLVLATIPNGCHIQDYHKKEVVCEENSEILFEIERCHLSSGFYDYESFNVFDCDTIDYDITENYEFHGKLRLYNNNPNISLASYEKLSEKIWEIQTKDIRGMKMNLPIRWITHAIAYEDKTQTFKCLPAPEWAHKKSINT